MATPAQAALRARSTTLHLLRDKMLRITDATNDDDDDDDEQATSTCWVVLLLGRGCTVRAPRRNSPLRMLLHWKHSTAKHVQRFVCVASEEHDYARYRPFMCRDSACSEHIPCSLTGTWQMSAWQRLPRRWQTSSWERIPCMWKMTLWQPAYGQRRECVCAGPQIM